MSNVKQGRQRERWEGWEYLRQVVWEDLSEEVTLDQRPDGSQAVNHTDVWEKSIRDKYNNFQNYFIEENPLKMMLLL